MKLKTLRISRGLSQTELAEKAHIDRAMVSRAESGKTGYSPATMKAIAEALGVEILDVDEFRERAGPNKNNQIQELVMSVA